MPLITMPEPKTLPSPPAMLRLEQGSPGQRRPLLQMQAPVRRRGDERQGRALEALGHAVEYLVDSRMFRLSDADARSDAEAAQILMRLSRAVFAECPEVISLRRRLRLWLAERLPRAAGAPRGGTWGTLAR